MQTILNLHAMAHPDYADYCKAVDNGVDQHRLPFLFTDGPMIDIVRGRTHWTVRNNPATLTKWAAAVGKCPGFTGKKTPKPRRAPAQGAMYRHPDGFALWIPNTFHGSEDIKIGHVTLKVNHTAKTLSGRVPDSWLIDLNAGPIVDEGEES